MRQFNSIQFNKIIFTAHLYANFERGGGTLRRNLQPDIPCELNEREFCAGINCKTNTVDIFQEQEILNFISVPAGTTLMTVVFSGQDDKTKDDIDKNRTKIHIISQLYLCT